MGNTYGRSVLETTGRPIMVSADGRPDWKVGGLTIDWSAVAAVSGSDVTTPDGRLVKIGEKYLRYGQVLNRITATETQTIDLSGDADPTGGTFPITVPGYGTTSALAYNISAANAQIALRLIAGLEAVTVGKTGFVYTITFPAALGDVGPVTVDATSLTSGGTIAVTIATTNSGAATGKYGPADTTLTNGQQTTGGGSQSFILNETVLEADPGSDHPAVFDGGAVWPDRIIAGTGNAPALSAVLAALPRLSFAKD